MACKELTEAELHELVEELMQNSDSEGVYDSGEGESEEDEVDNNTITFTDDSDGESQPQEDPEALNLMNDLDFDWEFSPEFTSKPHTFTAQDQSGCRNANLNS